MAPPRYDRNAEAQALGFRNYYEVRIRGGLAAARRGDITPATPRPTGEQLRTARGHGGLTDLLRDIQPESVVAFDPEYLAKDFSGDWDELHISVFGPDGTERDYVLRHLSDEELQWLIGELEDMETDFSPDYDLHALLPK